MIANPNVLQHPMSRRDWLKQFGMGLGGIALAEMLAKDSTAAPIADRGVLGTAHFAPKAKRIIYLFMSGGPSHLDLFDYKPLLVKRSGEKTPEELVKNVHLAQIG